MSLPMNPRNWPEAARDEYEERSAICEWLGKVPRDVADRQAEAAVRKRWANGDPGYALTAHPRAFRRLA